MAVTFSQELQIGGLSLLGIMLLLGGFIWKYKENMSAIDTRPQQIMTAQSTSFDWATIKQHNTPADCWLVIDQQVYALSPYLNQHPGGVKQITNFCGQDASAAFNTGKPGGHIHSSLAKKILQKYIIGSLQG